MAQRTYQESGQDGRSVLGMLSVQVEKDPKTGATIVRSVTPVPGAAGPQTASMIFDDGRKSIHALGASAAPPSSEELSQILSVIDGVGMTALLDDVSIMSKAEDTARVQGKELSSDHALATVNNSEGPVFSEKGQIENVPKTVAATTEVKQKTLGMDSSPKVVVTESEMLCEGPVTLMFMGYSDGRADGGSSEAEEPQGMLMAERVIITDDGEELVLGQDSAVAPSQKPAEDKAVQKASKETQEKPMFHDVPLEGKNEHTPQQGEDAGKGQQKSESSAEAEGKPKRKSCQCCAVM
ncbi:uncharacterized protein [Eucyclogobius newberryi]|uniref:uncharacterized protein n=1 Tax=Eucyclogobius newberryi TaxID=166745 RepID=UPI003B5BF641